MGMLAENTPSMLSAEARSLMLPEVDDYCPNCENMVCVLLPKVVCRDCPMVLREGCPDGEIVQSSCLECEETGGGGHGNGARSQRRDDDAGGV